MNTGVSRRSFLRAATATMSFPWGGSWIVAGPMTAQADGGQAHCLV
jgi:hypothetical protein